MNTPDIRWHFLDQFTLQRMAESLDDNIAEQAQNEQLRRKAAGQGAPKLEQREESEP
jgi:hypothetical protein